jgi:hypothetical protein
VDYDDKVKPKSDLGEIKHFLDNRRTHVGMLEQLLTRSSDPDKKRSLEAKLQIARLELEEANREYNDALKEAGLQQGKK